MAQNHTETDSLSFEFRDQLAQTYFENSDYSKALEIEMELLEIAQTSRDSSKLANRNYQVGKMYYFFRNDTSNSLAFPFFKKSYELASQFTDSSSLLNATRGLGVLYGEKNQFDSAFYFLHRADTIAKNLQDYKASSALNCILGESVYTFSHDTIKSISYYNKAFNIANKTGDEESIAYALRKLGYAFTITDQLTRAEEALHRSMSIYEKIKSKDGLLNIYSLLIQLYGRTRDYQKENEIYELLFALKQEVYNEQLSSSLAKMQVAYETEKKERENVLLKSENELKSSEILSFQNKQKVQLFLIAGLILILILVASAIFYVRRVKEKEKLATIEKQRFKTVIETEEKERTRIAKELHDSLGQLLSTAKLNVASMEDMHVSQDEILFTNSLNLIDDAISEVRTISHNLMPVALTKLGLISAVDQLAEKTNASKNIKVLFTTNDECARTESSIEIAVYRIIQEVVNNMIRHSGASLIQIELTLTSDQLMLLISDNGKGFDVDTIQTSKGIGWQSILSRISLLSGSIDIRSSEETGTSIRLNITLPKIQNEHD